MSTPRTYSAGQVLTATQVNDFAQGQLTRNTVASDVGPTSGTASLDLVTAPAITPASATRFLKISAHWRSLTGSNVGDKFAFRLQEGATVLYEQLENIVSTTEGHGGGGIWAVIAAPTAAAHTYKLTITRVNGSGTATVQAAATYPIQILVEDIGTN